MHGNKPEQHRTPLAQKIKHATPYLGMLILVGLLPEYTEQIRAVGELCLGLGYAFDTWDEVRRFIRTSAIVLALLGTAVQSDRTTPLMTPANRIPEVALTQVSTTRPMP